MSEVIEQFIRKCEHNTGEKHELHIMPDADGWIAYIAPLSCARDVLTLEHDWNKLAEAVGSTLMNAIDCLEAMIRTDQQGA